MQLLYLGDGTRHYGQKRVAVHMRKRWAFQFILKGRCSFLVREPQGGEREVRMAAPWLAVTAPACSHGWGGRVEDECEVAVFQFEDADPLMRSLLGTTGWRCVGIAPQEARAVARLLARCEAALQHFEQTSPVVYRVVGAELALLVASHLPAAELGPLPDIGKAKVQEALAWYGSHLAAAPRIAEAAEAVHLSPAHLRRLFHRVYGASPQAAFTQLQLDRAIELLRDPTLTLEAVAEASGFGSGSAFSRAFRKAFRTPPRAYRTHMQP